MISKEELFKIWAPSGNPWSAWAKPILFAHWPHELPAVEIPPAPDYAWVPPPSERRTLIVEMPGVRSLAMGLSLAAEGYRLVPMFSGSLPPAQPRHPQKAAPASPAVVDVESILAAIVQSADRIASIALASAAPPAFLIDQLRSTPSQPLAAARYDNRSWIYTTDFPSAQRFERRHRGSAGHYGVGRTAGGRP